MDDPSHVLWFLEIIAEIALLAVLGIVAAYCFALSWGRRHPQQQPQSEYPVRPQLPDPPHPLRESSLPAPEEPPMPERPPNGIELLEIPDDFPQATAGNSLILFVSEKETTVVRDINDSDDEDRGTAASAPEDSNAVSQGPLAQINELRSRESRLWQYCLRRAFPDPSRIPTNSAEFSATILRSIPRRDLGILRAANHSIIRYTPIAVGRELVLVTIDCSPSMNERMKSGFTRFDWARAAVINLCMQIADAGSTALVRTFYEKVEGGKGLIRPESLDAVIGWLLECEMRAGTDVRAALAKAFDDRDARVRAHTRCHIVIITDATDNANQPISFDESAFARRMGEHTYLHTLIIGSDAPNPLRTLAHTYRVYA